MFLQADALNGPQVEWSTLKKSKWKKSVELVNALYLHP